MGRRSKRRSLSQNTSIPVGIKTCAETSLLFSNANTGIGVFQCSFLYSFTECAWGKEENGADPHLLSSCVFRNVLWKPQVDPSKKATGVFLLEDLKKNKAKWSDWTCQSFFFMLEYTQRGCRCERKISSDRDDLFSLSKCSSKKCKKTR